MDTGAFIAFLLVYSIPCFIVAFVWGTARRCGFWVSFLLCFFTTPIIGFILTLTSESKKKFKDRQQIIELQKQQLAATKSNTVSVADELARLADLRDTGKISEEEYQKVKLKLLN